VKYIVGLGMRSGKRSVTFISSWHTHNIAMYFLENFHKQNGQVNRHAVRITARLKLHESALNNTHTTG